MDHDELIAELQEMFEELVSDTGADLETDADELAKLAGKLAQTLAKNRNNPGWKIGMAAAVDVLAMEAGIRTVGEADAFDARLHGMLESALRLGSKALSALL